jgi:hypothetical protein
MTASKRRFGRAWKAAFDTADFNEFMAILLINTDSV